MASSSRCTNPSTRKPGRCFEAKTVPALMPGPDSEDDNGVPPPQSHGVLGRPSDRQPRLRRDRRDGNQRARHGHGNGHGNGHAVEAGNGHAVEAGQEEAAVGSVPSAPVGELPAADGSEDSPGS